MKRQKQYPKSKYNKMPLVKVNGSFECSRGWDSVCNRLRIAIENRRTKRVVLVIECYQGVIDEEIVHHLKKCLNSSLFVIAGDNMHHQEKIRQMVYPDVTDDRIFGYMTRLTMEDFYDHEKINNTRGEIGATDGLVIVYGAGASLVAGTWDLLVYADMARWEIQLRMRRSAVDNLGIKNRDISDWMLLYKQGFFIDWRVCDRLKKKLIASWDFLLDTNIENDPKLVEGEAVREGLRQCVTQPFSVVPFFDPGPWGGQWLKHVCDLDTSLSNYAWCFNCIPEENSLFLKIGGEIVEIPSINLVFYQPRKLLGEPVHARFGDEFPIRFDFLDTMDGGNLSLQVHPLTEYIQERFGMHYTQDESYYLMDAKDDAVVYLGLTQNAEVERMWDELKEGQEGTALFDAEKFVQTWPVKKHDQLLIPAGTIHCSGKNCMVLEISATPYIFTFKLWDWGRLGLDGKPRPINIDHGKNSVQSGRRTEWVRKYLLNRFEIVAQGEGWVEERTGLHEREFIETRRHRFTKQVRHHTGGSVHVLCLVEGDEIVVESPTGRFKPFVVHYAEVFIVPADVNDYTIRPFGASKGKECVTVKAFVRY
jgi:mannose-6-phosphate isomerase class I